MSYAFCTKLKNERKTFKTRKQSVCFEKKCKKIKHIKQLFVCQISTVVSSRVLKTFNFSARVV